MEDLSAMLGNVLSDPESMSKIQSILDMLGSAGDDGGGDNDGGEHSQQDSPHSQIPSDGGSANPFGGFDMPFDPEMLMRLMPIVSRLKDDRNDPQSQLLMALKPHVSDKRKKYLDDAMMMLKISKVMGDVGNVL